MEELILTMEAAIRIVFDVVRVIEFLGGDKLMAETAFARERFCVAFMRFGERCGIGGNGDGAVTQNAMRRPGKVSGISPAGVCDEHLIHHRQYREQVLLFGEQPARIERGGIGEMNEALHKTSISAKPYRADGRPETCFMLASLVTFDFPRKLIAKAKPL